LPLYVVTMHFTSAVSFFKTKLENSREKFKKAKNH